LNHTEDISSAAYSEMDLLEGQLLELEGELVDANRGWDAQSVCQEFTELYHDAGTLQNPDGVSALLLCARLETKVKLLVERVDFHVVLKRQKRTKDEDSMLLAAAIAEAARRIINLILEVLGISPIEGYFFSPWVQDCADRIVHQDTHVLAMSKVALYAAHVLAHESGAAGKAWRDELNLTYQRTPVSRHSGLRDKSLVDFCLDGLIAAGHVDLAPALLLGYGDDKIVISPRMRRTLTNDSLGEIRSLLQSNLQTASSVISQAKIDLHRPLGESFEIDPVKLRAELLAAVRQLESRLYGTGRTFDAWPLIQKGPGHRQQN
jgi:hypothetical protein